MCWKNTSTRVPPGRLDDLAPYRRAIKSRPAMAAFGIPIGLVTRPTKRTLGEAEPRRVSRRPCCAAKGGRARSGGRPLRQPRPRHDAEGSDGISSSYRFGRASSGCPTSRSKSGDPRLQPHLPSEHSRPGACSATSRRTSTSDVQNGHRRARRRGLMFGSDYPHFESGPHSSTDPRVVEPRQEVRHKLFWENATRCFKQT